LERYTHGEAPIHVVTGGGWVFARVHRFRRAAEGAEVDTFAVDADLELLRIFESAHRSKVRPKELHLEFVLTVEWKSRLDQDAADRAKRQPFDVTVLRLVLSNAVDLAHGRCLQVADRQRADALSCRKIALQQNRRDAQCIGDVVESGARII